MFYLTPCQKKSYNTPQHKNKCFIAYFRNEIPINLLSETNEEEFSMFQQTVAKFK